MKINYQKELDRITQENDVRGVRPRLLLHVCCAPCSSYCMEYLSEHFSVTVFYYNPNIHPAEEYRHRVEEVRRLISEMGLKHIDGFVEGTFEPSDFYEAVKGLENCPEGGERCRRCYRLRLEETAKLAAEKGFDYFTTTLTISPLKSAEALNEIGEAVGEIYGVRHLPSDFKKRNGYKRSIELSREYGLYRQNYCGCIFSKNSRDKQAQENPSAGAEEK
ncbi:MAG: epoxyqueuosine reductase QueH [Oscillospiraceae bacterium]|nr:epoxyqueuosine reductase QueH [Oscillospiraceae bacterium]